MIRFQRISIALLVAYAASMTLIAGQRSIEAWFYGRMFHDVVDRGASPEAPRSGQMLSHARDFGLPRTVVEDWSLWLADLRAPLVVPLVALFFLIALGFALIPPPRPPDLDKE